MTRRLAVGVDWQGDLDREDVFARVTAADRGGVDSVWVAEAWGRDAFSLLTQLAERTARVQLATGIVNVYSRSPGALAQHFATLDELSGGRAIIGLGVSGPQVIEHFHGVPFGKPLVRIRETVEVIDTLLAGKPLVHHGEVFRLERGFTLRFKPVRTHIPVFIASLGPRSVRQTAEIADGWLPIWTPLPDLPGEIARFRAAAAKAGRDPASLLVRSAGTTVVTTDIARSLKAARRALAFYVARMGTFYREHLSRLGHGEAADAIVRGYAEGGSGGGLAATPEELTLAMGLVTDSVDAARARLAQEAAAGVDIHQVRLDGFPVAEMERIYAALAVGD
jgi:F420-dependent oxidoreductase-like protein